MYNLSVLRTEATSSAIVDRKVFTVFVGDNVLVRMGLEMMLSGTSFEIASTAATTTIGELAVSKEASAPLIIVHAGRGAPDIVRQSKKAFPQARVVLLHDDLSDRACGAVVEAGASGIVKIVNGSEMLLKSLELIAQGQVVIPDHVLRTFVDERLAQADMSSAEGSAEKAPGFLASSGRALSAREQEILGRLKFGGSNKVIARELRLSEATVKVHVKAILKKIGLANRTQAAIWAAYNIGFPNFGAGAGSRATSANERSGRAMKVGRSTSPAVPGTNGASPRYHTVGIRPPKVAQGELSR